ncbi:HupE/UreJ family protein [Tahibacter amnicola]|uniref:HupE/UreJ family protein n=1 Tax=Tahibacter amnicola TaxID=2976241 RepID=A0ABY6BI77_9GAMM|nr:HupE/UreJ family protein [Tahibacter amnicola]UXI69482.1 HupE/UreJ family protein [Tahibacter amnicola]
MAPLRNILLLLLTLCGMVRTVSAHSPSTSYLYLQAQESLIDVRWDVSLFDLNDAVTLDTNGDGAVTWGELRNQSARLATLLASHVVISQDGASCAPVPPIGLSVLHRQGDTFAVVQQGMRCKEALTSADLRYSFLFERNLKHRAIVTLNAGEPTASVLVASPEQRTVALRFDDNAMATSFGGFVVHGMHHILEGPDHILFVCTLIIAVLLPRRRPKTDARGLGSRLWELTKLVSVFTLAHSLTLGASALGLVAAPVRFFESAIAVSIVVMALNTLWPVVPDRFEKGVVFGFGLLHGLGFATLLQELSLPQTGRLASLAGFNIGVEIGQLAILVVAVPVVLSVSLWRPARAALVMASAFGIAVMGTFWFLQRALGIGA